MWTAIGMSSERVRTAMIPATRPADPHRDHQRHAEGQDVRAGVGDPEDDRLPDAGPGRSR